MNRHLTFLPALALAFAATLSCQAATDFYLKLEGIDGEATDERHAGEIEIQSFSWGLSNAGGDPTGGGTATGKATFQDIHFTRQLDKASPKLMLACANGQHIPSAVLVCRKSGGDGKPVEYYKITMIDILVTSVMAGGSSGGGLPTESISLNFSKIEWEYVPTNADGVAEEPVRAGFDLRLNEPVQ